MACLDKFCYILSNYMPNSDGQHYDRVRVLEASRRAVAETNSQ